MTELKKIVLHPMLSDEDARAVAKETLKDLVLKIPVGRMVAGQGIYLGQYSPKDRDGNSLSKTFNVYAAPQDLSETMKYEDAVKYIASLQDWNGFDGANYATDKEIYAALKDGSYNGGWIIPPHDLICGTDIEGHETQTDSLYKHRNTGSLKGTFNTADAGDSFVSPSWYWSSTEHNAMSAFMLGVLFSNGNKVGFPDSGRHRLSCRPVRLVPA